MALYPNLLGDAFCQLTGPVQMLHRPAARRVWAGEAKVATGNFLARQIAWLMGFPTKSGDMPIRVTFEPTVEGELWTRDFDGHLFRTLQVEGSGKDAGFLVERFGPTTVAIDLRVQDRQLHLDLHHWRVLGVAMPRWLLPKGRTFEYALDDKFGFHVELVAPLVGRIIKYKGTLCQVVPA